MSPDLNSVTRTPLHGGASASTGANANPPTSTNPSQPSSTTASRRASQIFPMNPPPLPLGASSPGTLPAAMTPQPFPPLSPGMTTGGTASSVSESPSVPMRHPRPLTAAELHLELEKEQEAVVNRLTRELTALRAHSASVASTASSATSGAFLLDTADPSAAHAGSFTGPTHPTASRRHRSSSSVSRNSAMIPGHHVAGASASSNNPAPHRYSISSQPGSANDVAPPRSASMGLSTPRYEEVAHYRQELEEAKKENELLKRKIRDLERTLRGRRSSSADARPRGRSARGSDAVAETQTDQ